MNEDILHTIAGIAMTLAGFSGLVVFFRPVSYTHLTLPTNREV